MTKIKTNRNNTNKVPPLRFPEFSGEWKEHKLAEYLNFKNGLNPNANRFGQGIKFISVMDILNNNVITYDCIRTSVQATADELAAFAVEKGDILFQRSSETLEDIGRANVYMDNKPAIFGGFVIRGKKAGDYNPLFFRYLLSNPLARKKIIPLGAGAQHFNIGQENLCRVKLNFPTLQEQSKIATIFTLIDDRISTQSKIIEDLEQLKSALTNQLYSGQLRFHEFADDWGVSTFGHLTEHFSHRNRDSKHYPVFSVTKDTGFIPQEEQFESREIAGDDISSYKIIRQGEFAYNPARINVGSIARYDNEVPCLISSLYVCIKPAADIDSDWLLYLLKSKRAIFYYNLYGEGGVRIYLFYPNFSRIKVKVPSIQEQHKIAALLKYIADKILQERKLKDLYMAQKQFLLQRMFI